MDFCFFREHKLHFSEEGEAGTLYIKPIDYIENIEALDTLVDNMAKETSLIRSIDSWTTEFKGFLKELDPSNREEFQWSSLNGESFQVFFQRQQNIQETTFSLSYKLEKLFVYIGENISGASLSFPVLSNGSKISADVQV